MSSILADLVNAKQTAEQAVKECQGRIVTLTTKADSLQDEIPAKSRLLEEAKASKEQALDAFVTDRISQIELDDELESYEQVRKVFSGAQEIVDATYRAAKRAEAELPALIQTSINAHTKVWQFIAADLEEKARIALGDKLVKAFVASAQCGGGNLQHFLVRVAGMPPSEAFNQIRDEIEAEYLEGGTSAKNKK